MTIQRTFIPGDCWLYFKIYTGFKTADTLIKDVFPSIINPLLDNNTISKWFFVRYNDPEFHLRLRLFLPDKSKLAIPIMLMNDALQYFFQNDLVWKLQLDTYQREVERYGIDTIELSEMIFYHDSSTFSKVLCALQEPDAEKMRWLSAIISIDYLLNDFSFTTKQKFDFLTQVKNSFAVEFSLNHSKPQLATKYRENKNDIEAVFSGTADRFKEIYSLFQNRSRKQKDLVAQIKGGVSNEEFLNNLLPSYTHMMMNRWFRSKQRMHEAIVYDLMYTFYKSKLKREGATTIN